MVRYSACLVMVAVCLPSAWANIPALSVQPGAEKKVEQVSPGDSRQKIIDEIRAGYDKVLDRLQQDDAGAETRENQKRIRANIEKLLKQQDPDNGANNNQSNSNNPRSPLNPKQAPEKPANQPQKAVEEPKPQPLPLERAKETKPANPIGNVGNTDRPANTIEDMMKERKELQPWPGLPAHHRRAMDTSSREQFMHRYEELLRAYYRNIAESSRREE